MKKSILLLMILSLIPIMQQTTHAAGADHSPVGYWKTIDKSGKERSVVKIWAEPDGTLKGRVEKIFNRQGEPENPNCIKCTGDKKDKPVIGMVFLWGFKGSGLHWKDGKILNPKNGKVYNCELDVNESGEKLEVFGFIRTLFKIGRTQTWYRQASL